MSEAIALPPSLGLWPPLIINSAGEINSEPWPGENAKSHYSYRRATMLTRLIIRYAGIVSAENEERLMPRR